jgi:hypothetical protein
MRTVKSRARKQDTSLTVTKATSQARRHVDAIIPGAMATVESKDSFDLDTNTALVVTTVTFPANTSAQDVADLDDEIHGLPGYVSSKVAGSRIVITRKR